MVDFGNMVRRAAKTARRTFGVRITYTTVEGVVVSYGSDGRPLCATS